MQTSSRARSDEVITTSRKVSQQLIWSVCDGVAVAFCFSKSEHECDVCLNLAFKIQFVSNLMSYCVEDEQKMPPKNRGPLQTVQRDTDVIKRKVELIEANVCSFAGAHQIFTLYLYSILSCNVRWMLWYSRLLNQMRQIGLRPLRGTEDYYIFCF